MKRDRLPEDHEDYQSRSEVKRNLHELLAFGQQLYALPKSVYASFPIPDELDAAMKEMGRIKSTNAQKRQWQHIGKILRNMDIEPLQKAYTEFGNGRKRLTRELGKIEDLRDDLLADKAGVFDKIIAEYPDCDIQHLRQLIRQANKEQSSDKSGKNFKKLFQFLKDINGL